jgi:3-hydroxybenzoate 6-monooxygenase
VTKAQNTPIAVAGGGIGGLTAALCLRRLGYRVTVLEQAAQLREIGAGIQMGPNAFKIFDILGIAERVSRVAVFPDRYQINDALTGEPLTHIPYGQTCIDRFGYPYGLVHRHDLHEILAATCKEAGVDVLLQFKVEDVDDRDQGVHIHAADGRVFRAEALIGADGLRSTVRSKLLGGEADPISPGLVAARAVLPIDAIPAAFRDPRITIWLGPDCHVIYYPLRAGQLFNLAAVFASDADPAAADWNMRRELDRAYAGLTSEVSPLLEYLEPTVYRAGTERIPIRSWSRGGVTLLGDAAHAMTQNLAQGGCMALEDGLVLAEAVLDRPDDLPAAFNDYCTRRSERTVHVQYVARLIGDVLHLKSAERDSRNAVLKARVPQSNLEFFSWLYQGIDLKPATRARLAPQPPAS